MASRHATVAADVGASVQTASRHADGGASVEMASRHATVAADGGASVRTASRHADGGASVEMAILHEIVGLKQTNFVNVQFKQLFK